MSLPGRVVEVQGEWVVVEVMPRSECNGCIACKSLLDEGEKAAPKKVRALKGQIELAEGDQVILDTDPGTGSLAAIIVFGVPMASFFTGLIFTGPIISRVVAEPQEWHALLAGVTLLSLSLIAVGLLSRAGCFDRLSLKILKKA